MAAYNRALGNHAAPKYLPRRVVQKKSLLCLVVIGEFPRSCTSPGLLRKRIRRFFGGNVSYFVGFVLPSSMCRIFLFAISTRLLCSNLPAPTQFCLVAMYAENSTHVVRLFLFSPPSLPSFPTKWMVGRGGRPSPPLFCKGGPRKIAHHPLRGRRAQRLRINGEVHRKIRVSPKQETGILKLFASLGNLVKNSQTVRCALAQSP